MTGEGTVLRVSDKIATVSIKKTSACSHDCSECSICTMPSYEMEVANPVGAMPGDSVVIEADTKKILFSSLLVYMLPVFLLIAASLICDANDFGAVLTVAIFAALIGAWIFVIRIANKKFKAQNTIVSVIKG
ncbi:MAG: SoxR reducing system RseC family protein [Clostridia bacterium]|nr:SoxR reducing system RseC family protein [Clostridia bacterium]